MLSRPFLNWDIKHPDVEWCSCRECHKIHVEKKMVENMTDDCQFCDQIVIEGRLKEVSL